MSKIAAVLNGLSMMYESRRLLDVRDAITGSPRAVFDLLKEDPELQYDPFLDQVRKCLQMFPDARLDDCFSRGQVESKRWLVSCLASCGIKSQATFLCGGWYGTLGHMLLRDGVSERVISIDIDPGCAPVAERLNRSWVVDGWKFKSVTADMYEVDYLNGKLTTTRNDGTVVDVQFRPDLIINTSCEHITAFDRWYSMIPEGRMVVLQSNDFFDHEEHVNCVGSENELSEMAPMTEVIFRGTLQLQKYKRFMVIGKK